MLAQTAESDTTIYQVAEEPPRFPVCETLDTTIEFKKECAQLQLLAFMNRNIFYPLEARQNGTEGTVVLSFVVEKDGSISYPKILKDIGDGCGLEALRVVNAMMEEDVKWVPGKNNGQPVRTAFNLPVRFRLQEAPPYTLVGRDTIYTTFDTALDYEGGIEALTAQLNSGLDYPPSGNDSCAIGVIDMQLLIDRRGGVRILELVDYNDLGFDFWDEAVKVATSTAGKWIPATYQGVKVPTAYDISLTFSPDVASCKARVDSYQRAVKLLNEGADLYDKEEQDAGITKMTEAISMFPKDANFLYTRGQAYLNLNRFPEACADLSLVKAIALVDWFDSLLPIICNQ